MTDIIHLLPDSVANQIAAGEVIQRPASVVKELVENAVDAGADEIQVIVKDAGRTLVQVIDNGQGMSEHDARMAFERHATSKITSANDLFSIRTMGFRGEALASIAAIAQVELKTRQEHSELGTKIEIAGSKIQLQEAVNCPKGTNFIIKNIFFNVPARRRFLKTNHTELRHVITEFQKIALSFPDVAFTLTHNDQQLFALPAANTRLRVVGLMGMHVNSQLIPINVETNVLGIKGFIGKPESARKTAGDQFFFVNNRYFKHPYLHKAIINAYSNLIAADSFPSYFLYFEVDPGFIDVNIHPSKTEIKFEDEKLIWKILNAAVRESLGKFNIVPSIDFNTEGQITIPANVSNKEVVAPTISINPDYNPFNSYSQPSRREISPGWESLYNDFETANRDSTPTTGYIPSTIVLPSRGNMQTEMGSGSQNNDFTPSTTFLQLKNRFIVTPVKSGLMIIDQQRAHERVLFEKFIATIKTSSALTQQLLFAETLNLSPADISLLDEISREMKIFGFRIDQEQAGQVKITGIPPGLEQNETIKVLETIMEACKTGEIDPAGEVREQLASIMAREASVKKSKSLSVEEISTLVGELFKCEVPLYSPTGEPIISIIDNDELDKRFQ